MSSTTASASASTSIPASATAWRIHKTGPPPVTMQQDQIDVPKPGQGQILVEVRAASVNPVDWKVTALAPSFFQKFPRTMASDFAGVVVGHGSGLTAQQTSTLPIGTRVAGINNAALVLNGKLPGTLATYIVAPAGTVAPLPERLSWAQGASIPLTSLTAFTLAKHAKAGQRVLVVGGSTSVGLSLLQQLKQLGVSHITATASDEKIKLVRELGADETVDYRQVDVPTELAKLYPANSTQGFDVVLDTIGNLDLLYASGKFIKPDGKYANVGASELAPTDSLTSLLPFLWSRIRVALPRWLSGVPREYKEEMLTTTDMPELGARYLDVEPSKALKPVIDSEYPFDQAKDAYQRLMTGRALGKIVVHVQ